MSGRRGVGSEVMMWMIGIVIALALGYFAIKILTGGSASFDERLTTAGACDGVAGSLGGGKGRCWKDGACGELDDKDPKAGFYWSSAGQGWGCPKAADLTDEQKKNDVGPFCCIQVSNGRNPPGIGQVSQAKADSVQGSITLVKGEGASQVFLGPDKPLAKVAATEKMRTHYAAVAEDGESCHYTLTMSFGTDTLSSENDLKCANAIVDFGTPLAFLDRQDIDHSRLDGGGSFTVTVKGKAEHTATFAICPKGGCT